MIALNAYERTNRYTAIPVLPLLVGANTDALFSKNFSRREARPTFNQNANKLDFRNY
jgi:hypothetical protein